MEGAVFLLVGCCWLLSLADAQSSCKELLACATGPVSSGVYTLKDSNGDSYSAYCDMNTDGGGWTLIASVHEDNPLGSGRCSKGDRWSSEQGNSPCYPKGEDTWAKMDTFGDVELATRDDYKNPGYYNIDAANLMIWHVPNKTPLENWRNESYLRYRTENRFLLNLKTKSFGKKGNLYSLYQVYPVESGVYSWPDDLGPIEPVVFDAGCIDDLVPHYGPRTQPNLTPGYIQFRALSALGNNGYAYALCPGVKMNDDFGDPAPVCIGSTGYNYASSHCGDFSAWAVNGYGTGKDWSVDEVLIETTFLLFYR